MYADRSRQFEVMAHTFLLVHSPLIGPYSWRPTAEELERRGHQTFIPNLLPALALSSGFADAFAELVAETVDQASVTHPLLLVGHSAAGAYLPAIRSALDREVQAHLFVDARLPSRGASLAEQDSPEEVQQRRELAREGILPPWSEWFDQALIEEAIPERVIRKRFLAELEPIPMALFEETISFNSDWPDAPCAYLRLSEFYQPLAQEASSNGWPVLEANAGHLHPLTHPRETAGLIEELLDQAGFS